MPVVKLIVKMSPHHPKSQPEVDADADRDSVHDLDSGSDPDWKKE